MKHLTLKTALSGLIASWLVFSFLVAILQRDIALQLCFMLFSGLIIVYHLPFINALFNTVSALGVGAVAATLAAGMMTAISSRVVAEVVTNASLAPNAMNTLEFLSWRMFYVMVLSLLCALAVSNLLPKFIEDLVHAGWPSEKTYTRKLGPWFLRKLAQWKDFCLRSEYSALRSLPQRIAIYRQQYLKSKSRNLRYSLTSFVLLLIASLALKATILSLENERDSYKDNGIVKLIVTKDFYNNNSCENLPGDAQVLRIENSRVKVATKQNGETYKVVETNCELDIKTEAKNNSGSTDTKSASPVSSK